MKRCPECRRDYYDDTLAFCLEDGTALLQGSVPSPDEPQTAILHETAPPQEAATRAQIHTTEQTAVFPSGAADIPQAKGFDRRLILAPLALAVIVAGAFFGYRYLSSETTQIGSIAVLPFQNVGGDPNFEYLSDGIAESLINSLTQIQQLKVIARNTAFRYKGKDVDAEQVGRDLGVRAVLTGRVRQVGDRLNIQVDLVDAVTGAQLWGEEYDRPAADALSIKQAIAREITDKLRLRLSGEQQQQMIAGETKNAEAYQSYLKGRFYWNRRTADGLQKAISEFQQAIERDPNFALGYVGLADSYSLLEEYAGTPTSETLPKARAAVDRALQIDDSLAEAHTSLAFIHVQQWRWAEAEQQYKRAIALNPNYPTTHHWFSIYFRIKRQFDDSLRHIRRAQELDPLSPVISSNVAQINFIKGDIDAATGEWEKNIELNPNYPGAYSNLGIARVIQGRHEEGIALIEKAAMLSDRASIVLGDLGYSYAVAGRRSEALQILKELEDRYARRETIGQYLARVYMGLGDHDKAFEWLEKDFGQRSGLLPIITSLLQFDELRSDPRYTDLVRRMNLAE